MRALVIFYGMRAPIVLPLAYVKHEIILLVSDLVLTCREPNSS